MRSGYVGYLPVYIRHSKKLNPTTKLVYAEITACLEDSGVCKKPNVYFSKALHIHKTTVSEQITKLRKLNFINVYIEYEKGTQKFKSRYITLTYPQIQVGVEGDVNNTHIYLQEGESLSNTTVVPKNGVYPNSKQETLLDNNINKLYTNRHYSNIPLNKKINKKQEDALKKIVFYFYNVQSERLPNVINSDWRRDTGAINGSINTLYDIIKKDGFNYDDVLYCIKWALFDKFWATNLVSLRVLRENSSNGITKFQNIYKDCKGTG